MEIESNSVITCLDVPAIRKWTALATKVYRKSTHTGRYLNIISNNTLHVKNGIIQSLHNAASTTCQE
jgi:hypothetical protein